MEHWYCLYSKPRAERIVCEALQRKGIESFLPIITRLRQMRGQRRAVSEPLFPCYLFAQLDLETVGFSAVRWIPGVRDLVGTESVPIAVPNAVVQHIRMRLTDSSGLLAFGKRFASGEQVRITDGPFRDMDAVFAEHLPGKTRVRVFLNILGRSTPTELDTDWLEKTGRRLHD